MLFAFFAYGILNWYQDLAWRNRTAPLDKATVEDICIDLDLGENPLCAPGTTVYAPDFFPYIKEYFEKKDDEYMTKGTVDARLIEYQLRCEELNRSEGYPVSFRLLV